MVNYVEIPKKEEDLFWKWETIMEVPSESQCPICENELVKAEGCAICYECGWSLCEA